MVRLRWIARFAQQHPNLIFWCTFLVLNGLLFAPIYLFNQETTTFLPGAATAGGGFVTTLSRLFLWRENLDPLRLSLELTLVAALWIAAPWLRRRAVRWAIVATYLAAACYSIYEAIVVSIYLADPVFYSQYFLARDGLPFLARHMQASWTLVASAVVALVAVGLLLVGLVNMLLYSAAQTKLHRATRVTVALLAVYVLFAAFRYQVYTASPEMVVSSLGFKLQKNIAESRQLYTDIVSFDDQSARRAYDYAAFQFGAKRPDIYMIFVESYGSALATRPEFRRTYSNLLTELEDTLGQNGWHSRTAMSDSPMWGGGSWMAYTSLLFGLRIDSHPQYLSLFNKYQYSSYPDLGRTLKAQGYYYAWVSSISNELDDLTWAKYSRFLGVDEWLRYRDLAYVGPRYGWGPAPPDQFTLNDALTKLQKTKTGPLFFVTITQNSHYPWVPQPELVDDWRTLNQAQPDPPAPNLEEISTPVKRLNYLTAIDYQLRMLTDLILHNGDENSLFILIGDHQPPQVSRRADGWSTPMHIISKDADLVDAFAPYGFSAGLHVAEVKASLRHEGFYSLFMRVLFERFGGGDVALPAYLPNGVSSEAPSGASSGAVLN